ncbi:hypothetical protein TNCT_500191 [Trichonephila clavata]|uniref:Uncharacterized protein n=1 Tax=Trichonephila clavata TaxID=2740835 RepID=A0A8X6FFT5_TRICU|nr:hypothetical protein TNCT_500191 [Trichonephila clavata]
MRTISPVVKTAYFFYFGVKVGELDKPCTQHPVTHSATVPILDPPKKYEIERDFVEEEFIRTGTSHNPDFEAEDLNEPHRLNQVELKDFVRDLNLPKQEAELLASRLKQWNSTLTRHQNYRVQD